jgi:hypothetical protein
VCVLGVRGMCVCVSVCNKNSELSCAALFYDML